MVATRPCSASFRQTYGVRRTLLDGLRRTGKGRGGEHGNARDHGHGQTHARAYAHGCPLGGWGGDVRPARRGRVVAKGRPR